MTEDMTTQYLSILQHSLGCDEYGRSGTVLREENDGCFGHFRNRYVSDPTPDLVALVEAGLMADHGANSLCGGMHYYRVTQAGLDAMRRESPKPPKLTRSQSRYRQFLDHDCDCSFGEWLKNRWYKPAEPRRWSGEYP